MTEGSRREALFDALGMPELQRAAAMLGIEIGPHRWGNRVYWWAEVLSLGPKNLEPSKAALRRARLLQDPAGEHRRTWETILRVGGQARARDYLKSL